MNIYHSFLDRSRQNMASLACMDIPSLVPEILTTQSGPFFIVQFLKGNHLLSALHSYSDTLSVHSMDISLIPLYIYKIPKDCSDIIVTSNIMFTKQDIDEETNDEIVDLNVECDNGDDGDVGNLEVPPPPPQSPPRNAAKTTTSTVGVVGCSTTILRIGEDTEFNPWSMLGQFPLPNETIIDMHRVPHCPMIYDNDENADGSPSDLDSNDGSPEKYRRISTESYVRQMRRDNNGKNEQMLDYNDRKIVIHDFPMIELDKCFVVSNKSLYLIEFK